MSASLQLKQLISQSTKVPEHAALSALTGAILKNHGDAVRAILLYGSCLRSKDYLDGLVDLYVIVNDYAHGYHNTLYKILNHLLPPNVFYLEVPAAGHTVRAKYAVISARNFARGTSGNWFHSYLWGRFAQPTGIVHARDQQTLDEIHACLAQAVLTFCSRVLPRLPQRFGIPELWRSGLAMSYAAELRAETGHRGTVLFETGKSYYLAITECALAAVPCRVTAHGGGTTPEFSARIPDRIRRASRIAWWLRRVLGKPLSVLRLLKGLMTFHGGVDYIAWKLERHTGERIEISPRVRRYPAIFIWGLFWRLYRRGIFR